MKGDRVFSHFTTNWFQTFFEFFFQIFFNLKPKLFLAIDTLPSGSTYFRKEPFILQKKNHFTKKKSFHKKKIILQKNNHFTKK